MSRTRIHVLPVGTALPGPSVETAELTRRLGLDAEQGRRIGATLGIRTRHLCADLDGGPPHATLAGLATTAAENALAAAGLTAGDVGAVVMSTATPDRLMPATVNVVADRLGIDQVPSYQILAGATGALQAIDVAAQMLSTGRQDTVLVVAGDVSTKQLDLTTKPATEPERAGRDTAALGDAAAAVVVTTRGCPDAYLLHRVHVRQGSAGHRPGRTAGWLGAAERGTRGQIVTYDPELIAAVAPKLAGDVLTEVLDGLGWRPEDLARLLPPQLPGGVAEVTAGLLGVPAERCSDRIGRLGDAANALPLFQLAHAHPRTGAGDRVAGVAVDPSGWAVADFALRRVR